MKINDYGYIQITKEKNGKNYIFYVPQGSQYGECYDVFYEMLAEVMELAKKGVEEARPKKAEEVKPEAPKDDKGE